MTLAKMGIYASLPLMAGTSSAIWRADGFPIIVLRRTGNVNLARRWVAIAGFSAFGGGHGSRGARARSESFGGILLRGVFRVGMDRWDLLGGDRWISAAIMPVPSRRS